MTHNDYLGIIPEQYAGKEIEAEASVKCPNENDAVNFYNISKVYNKVFWNLLPIANKIPKAFMTI